MKHVPGAVKDKYEILGVIGEGIEFINSNHFNSHLKTGSYGVVLKARKKVIKINLNK